MGLAYMPFLIKHLRIESCGLISLPALLHVRHSLFDISMALKLGPEMASFTRGSYSAQSIHVELTVHGNPYNGHALLIQNSPVKPAPSFGGLGSRGVDTCNPNMRIMRRGKSKRISEQDGGLIQHRQTIEPIIGSLKSEIGKSVCSLCAAKYNIQQPLRMISNKGCFLYRLCLCLQKLGVFDVAEPISEFKPNKYRGAYA
jgi:hypothetical protein